MVDLWRLSVREAFLCAYIYIYVYIINECFKRTTFLYIEICPTNKEIIITCIKETATFKRYRPCLWTYERHNIGEPCSAFSHSRALCRPLYQLFTNHLHKRYSVVSGCYTFKRYRPCLWTYERHTLESLALPSATRGTLQARLSTVHPPFT